MSSSGLIYAVIVGAWAAYLVPMWLRRQDELNEARPTERFSTAIRLLSGRGAMERRYAAKRGLDLDTVTGLDAGAVLDPGEPDDAPRERPHPPVRHDRVPHPAPHGPGPSAAATRAKVLARRRRTTTVLFMAFTAGAVVAAVGGLEYLWAPAAPGLLLTCYIVHLRRAERHRFEFTMDQRRAVEAARRLRERPQPSRPSASSADRRAIVEQTDHAEWIDQQQLAPDDAWDAAPAPMPTYVTAPVAPRAHEHGHAHHAHAHGHHEAAELTDLAPDPWSAARSAPAATDTPDPRRRTPLFDQYAPPSFPTPDPLDRPRAANE